MRNRCKERATAQLERWQYIQFTLSKSILLRWIDANTYSSTFPAISTVMTLHKDSHWLIGTTSLFLRIASF